MTRYQLVWWGFREMGWGLELDLGGLGLVYRWRFMAGPLEIRRWADPPLRNGDKA